MLKIRNSDLTKEANSATLSKVNMNLKGELSELSEGETAWM